MDARPISKPARKVLHLRIRLNPLTVPPSRSIFGLYARYAPISKRYYNRGMPTYFSGEGDDGSTGLLGSERVPKYHLRPTAFGTVDEASAALGLSRATALSKETISVIHEVQKDLYTIMVELATVPEEEERFQQLDPSRLSWIEGKLESFGDRVTMPKDFILPGDSLPAAALDLARTVVRRAERQVVRLDHESKLSNPTILSYLNRLSSLCFVLSLWENETAGGEKPTIAKSRE